MPCSKFIRKSIIPKSFRNEKVKGMFDVNKNEFSKEYRRRPKIELNIRKAQQSEWKIFKDYHYLSSTHNTAAHKYICEINNEIVGWCSVLHFPHPKVKNMKKIHRIVILPDYQGLGIGNIFLNEIAKMYKNDKFRVTITTSTPSFIGSLSNSKLWVMTRKPCRVKKNGKGSTMRSASTDRLTASFEFIEIKE
jgi:GNAT superfamily N-acetyltransferase